MSPQAEPWAGQLAGYFGLTFDDIKHLTSAGLPDDDPLKGKLPGDWLLYCIVLGVIAGLVLYQFRKVEDNRWRFWGGCFATGLMVFFASEYIAKVPGFDNTDAQRHLGWYLLLGVPFFYLLSFCGDAEESEAEIMTWCGMLGVGLQLLIQSRSGGEEASWCDRVPDGDAALLPLCRPVHARLAGLQARCPRLQPT